MPTPIDRDKLQSIGYLRGGRTRSSVREGRDSDGRRYKSTKDELGNVTTERAGDRQDVMINAPRVIAQATTTEER